jgi:hypothetical protein
MQYFLSIAWDMNPSPNQFCNNLVIIYYLAAYINKIIYIYYLNKSHDLS